MSLLPIYKYGLLTSIVLTFLGSFLRIMHWPNGRDFLNAGLLLGLIPTFIGIYYLYKSQKVDIVSKIVWSLGLILFGWLGGLVFYYKKLKTKDI